MKNYRGSEEHVRNARAAREKGRLTVKKNMIERREHYLQSPTLCQCCGEPLKYEKRKNKYCTKSCSAKVGNVGRVRSEESKQKTKQTLAQTWTKKGRQVRTLKTVTCRQCGKEFETIYKRKTCSKGCDHAWKGTPEAREANRQQALERVKNGTHKGWMSRTGLKPSYPEQYFINLFQAEKIEGWTREYSAGSRYFIDFAFPELNLAVEVDGGQHEWEENKRKDLEKDTYLTSTGWKVFRIKWRNPVNEKNRKFLYPQIAELKKLLGR